MIDPTRLETIGLNFAITTLGEYSDTHPDATPNDARTWLNHRHTTLPNDPTSGFEAAAITLTLNLIETYLTAHPTATIYDIYCWLTVNRSRTAA